jgi:hypothetical protein
MIKSTRIEKESRNREITVGPQSCIKGLLGVRDFCIWAVWAARPVQKKRVWSDYEQLLRVVVSCFQAKKCQSFFKNIVGSALKSYIK